MSMLVIQRVELKCLVKLLCVFLHLAELFITRRDLLRNILDKT